MMAANRYRSSIRIHRLSWRPG